MRSLRDNYNDSAEGKRRMNIVKAYFKELYFKRQDVFTFEKYVNRRRESYNTCE